MFIRDLLNKKKQEEYGTFTAEGDNSTSSIYLIEEKFSSTDDLVIDIDQENKIPRLKSWSPNIWKVISIGLLLLSSAGFLFVTRKMAQTKVQVSDAFPDIEQALQTSKKSQIEDHVPDAISYIEKSLQNGTSNICQMPKVEALCKGNLGIPRQFMPQLSHHVAKKYYAEKRKEGILVEPRVVAADKLIMIQNELVAENILDMFYSYMQGKFDPCMQVIPVSIDNDEEFIIDGHHRAITCIFTGGKQHVMAIKDSVEHILDDLKNFKGVTYNTSIFKPPKKSKAFKDKNADITDIEMAKKSFGIKWH